MGDWSKVAGAGGAGALVGGMFPLFLFDKFGVSDLIKKAADTTAGAPFAITIFAMVAIMIVGIGALLSKTDISANRMVTVLLSVFGLVFFGGFITTVVLSFVDPQVKVSVSFPEYADEPDFFKQLKLSAYVDDHTLVASDGTTRTAMSPAAHATCRTVIPIEFGIVGIRAMEERLRQIQQTSVTTCFPEVSVPVICTLESLKSTPACQTYAQSHRQPVASSDF